MPGGVIVERTDAGSLDSVADSLREPATPLGMTVLRLVFVLRAFPSPTLPQRTRKSGAPYFAGGLDLHLERVATFHSQVSSKAMIWELERVPSFSAKSTL